MARISTILTLVVFAALIVDNDASLWRIRKFLRNTFGLGHYKGYYRDYYNKYYDNDNDYDTIHHVHLHSWKPQSYGGLPHYNSIIPSGKYLPSVPYGLSSPYVGPKVYYVNNWDEAPHIW